MALGVAEIAGKQHAALLFFLMEFQIDTGRAQDMPRVNKSGADAGSEFKWLIVACIASKMIGAVKRIQHGVKGRLAGWVMAVTSPAAGLVTCLFLLQVG